MKISTKGRYGLRALVDIAAHMEQMPIPLAVTAKRQNISLNYLEQVFGTLRKAGIVKSIKGSCGGYMLAKDADLITVQEVLEALEGSFSITDRKEKEELDFVSRAIQELVWDQIDERVNAFLKQRTIGQLVREYQELDQSEQMMYYI